MADVRSNSADALLELSELASAVREIGLSAHRLAAAVREIAAEAQQLAGTPSASPERQHALANYARSISSTADAQATALEELRRGVDAWVTLA